jgi:hypothetical protein
MEFVKIRIVPPVFGLPSGSALAPVPAGFEVPLSLCRRTPPGTPPRAKQYRAAPRRLTWLLPEVRLHRIPSETLVLSALSIRQIAAAIVALRSIPLLRARQPLLSKYLPGSYLRINLLDNAK